MLGKVGGEAMSRWVSQEYSCWSRWQFPKSGGCYAVFADCELIYVGSSKSIFHRMSDHGIRYGYSEYIITPWGQFKKIVVKYRRSVHYGDWAMIELRLLRRLRPRFNRLHVKVKVFA